MPVGVVLGREETVVVGGAEPRGEDCTFSVLVTTREGSTEVVTN